MLILESVNPTGLGPYGASEDLPLVGQGLVWLHGKNCDRGDGSNGAGKSWIFHALSVCLFGRLESFSEGGMAGGDELINELWGRGCCARVVFRNAAGERWRITYARKFKGEPPYPADNPACYPYGGTDLYLEEQTPEGWVDRRASEMPQTRKRAQQAVGITYARYLATTYLAQGRGFDFLRGTHAQRLAILTDAVGLGFWDDAQAAFSAEQKRVQAALEDCRRESARLQGQLAATRVLSGPERAHLEAQIREAEKALAAAGVELAREESWVETLSGQVVALPVNPHVAAVQHAEHEHAQALGDQQRVEREAVARAGEMVIRERAALASVDQEVHGLYAGPLGELEARARALEERFRQNADLLAAARAGTPLPCPTCGARAPDAAHLEAERQHLEAERVDAERKRLDLVAAQAAERDQRAEAARRALAADWLAHKLVDAAARREKAERVQAAEAALRKATELWTCWNASEAPRGDAAAMAAKLAGHREGVRQAQRHVAGYQEQLGRLRYQLEENDRQAEVRSQLVQEVEAGLAALRAAELLAAEWTWLAKNIGDRGCKAWRLASATERLNQFLAESLQDLDGSFQVWARPWRTKKGGREEDASDRIGEFTLYVQEGGKKAVPLALYSGGETSLIAFALLVAFWHLAEASGQGTSLLLLDEAVGALDGRGAEMLVRFLEGLRASGKSVFLVSHSSLVDSVRWDARWIAEKKNGLSRLLRFPSDG